MTCNSCHDSAPATNAHGKHHTTGSIMTGKSCDACHDATATGSSAIANKIMHVNGTPNVVLNTTFGGSFSGGGCSSVYCHSDGAGGAPNTAVSDWTATTLPANCTGCHNNNESTGSQMASGAHAAHINTTSAGSAIGRTLGCVDCHAGTVSADQTIGMIANHIDGGVDILVNIDGTTCSNIQCHSNGNFDGSVANTVFNNPTWATGSLGCVDCHGDGGTKAYPTYANGGVGAYNSNSHTAHVATSSLTCNECHAETSTAGASIDGTTPANHVNQTADVAFTQGGSYTDGAETCNATYCHGSGDSPNWGTAGPLACNTCHAANNTLPGSHSVHYSVASVASDRSAANASTSGNYVFNCGVCHDNAAHAGGMADAGNHVTANVIFNGTIAGAGTHIANATWGTDAQGFAWTQAECSATYCHSQGGSNTTPQWGVDSMTCGSCHQASPTTNSHADHLTAGVMITGVSCDACHDATATGSSAIANKTMHVNGAKNVILNSTYGGSFASNQCSTVYCHSDGQSTPTYATPTWGGAAADCVYCHGGVNGSLGGAGTALTSPHKRHTGFFGADCNACHNGTVDNATTINAGKIANHVNGSPTLLINSTFGGTYSAGVCSSTTCHGTATQYAWAASGATANCSLCHGMQLDPSDGRDTGGDTAATDLQVGAHVAHLTNATSISGPIACSQCHEDYTGGATYYDKVMAAGHLDGGGADFLWGALATNGGSLSPSYAGGVCSNTYCHGNQMPMGSSSGADTTPVWNAVGYLTGSYNNDCGQCHGFPPTDNSKHTSMTVGDGSNCSNCHSHLYDAGDSSESGWAANGTAFSNALLHIDGSVQASGTCNTCHGYPPTIGDGKTYIGSSLEGKGAHTKHVNHLSVLNSVVLNATSDTFTGSGVAQVCGVCHNTSSDANHMNGADNDVNRNMAIPAMYQFGASAPIYNGAPATSSGTQFKSCFNVSCHFKETPGWQDPATAGN
jgi:predicted CxxxxCH...CXXCH cytochrome family protein